MVYSITFLGKNFLEKMVKSCWHKGSWFSVYSCPLCILSFQPFRQYLHYFFLFPGFVKMFMFMYSLLTSHWNILSQCFLWFVRIQSKLQIFYCSSHSKNPLMFLVSKSQNSIKVQAYCFTLVYFFNFFPS